uniref:MFS domain-containing protein n=1 Tax=Caenorhabditis tropicalis TaxID=1561998 RepID=A0A1I7T7H4_9PELO
MAGGRPAAGCCCFINNVRFPILILTTLSVAALYSTLLVFNLLAILDPEVDLRPVPGLDTLHGSSYKGYDRLKRELAISKIPSKVVRFDQSTEEDDGHPILPPTENPQPIITTEAPTTKKTEKPVPIFITNRPETTTERIERATTAGIESTTQYDVVAKEVEKSLKKLRDAEEGTYEDQPGKGETVEQTMEPFSRRLKRGVLYAAPGIGVILGSFLTISLTKKYGARKVFTACMCQSAILIIIFLYFQKRSYSLLLIVRFLQGVLFSSVFPTMGSLLIQWGPLKEQLFFLTVMLMFVSIGPVVSWSVANYCHALELAHDYVYYIQCVVLAFLALIWSIFYRDHPQKHPWVSGVELNRIVAGKVKELNSNRALSEAYTSIFRSLSAWSIWTSAFGFFSAISFISTYLPSFLSSPDVFIVESLGVHSSLPFQLLPLSCAIFATLNILFKPSTRIIRILNTTAFVISAILIVSIILVAHLQTKAGLLSLLLISMLPFGLAIVTGFVRSLTVVGRVFAEQIVALCAIPFGLAFTIIPLIVTYSVAENKLSEWMKVAMFLFFVFSAAAIEFAVFGRGKSASWAASSWDPLAASTKMQSLALINFNQDECGLYELRRIEPKQ